MMATMLVLLRKLPQKVETLIVKAFGFQMEEENLRMAFALLEKSLMKP